MIELKNSKTTYLGTASGRERYAMDAFIGAVQMREPEGEWQDIKPQLARDADGWHIEGAPYYAEIKDDGTRLFCPDRNERSQYLRLPAISLFSGLDKYTIENASVLDGLLLPNQVTMPTDWGEIRIIFSNTGMHFEILFNKAPPASVFGKTSPRILLDAETAGYDITQLLNSASGLGIPKPRLMTANPEVMAPERWLDWSYKNGQLELGFDFGSLPFPILLKNTTIDVNVGAGADDGYVYPSVIDNSSTIIYTDGAATRHAFTRFTGITIPQSSTIDTALWYIYERSSQGDATNPQTDIYADDQNNPSAVSSYTDYLARPLTTAYVEWDLDPGSDAYYSKEIKTVIQELVDSNDYSNKAIQILWKGSGNSSGRYRGSWTYEGGSSYWPKIHIEYTAGGATDKTASDSGAGADAKASFLATIARSDIGSGVDSRFAFLASLVKADNGSGVEQSMLTSLVAKLAAETGSGIDIANLIARLVRSEAGYGVDAGMIPGLKSISGSDEGVGRDALKALLSTPGEGSDMKLPGRLGQVRIPSKGVSL